MPMDFTVIQAVRQRFHGPGWEISPPDTDLDAPLVGESKEYAFACPGVDSGQWALLQYQSNAVGRYGNTLRVNGVDIPGGMQPGAMSWEGNVFSQSWASHMMLVPPDTLREKDNILFIEASSGLDASFIIDNVIMLYKTAHPVSPGDVILEPIGEGMRY